MYIDLKEFRQYYLCSTFSVFIIVIHSQTAPGSLSAHVFRITAVTFIRYGGWPS
jgi:hypothetical protein